MFTTFATSIAERVFLAVTCSDIIQLIFSHLRVTTVGVDFSGNYHAGVRGFVRQCVGKSVRVGLDGCGVSIRKSIRSFCLRALGSALLSVFPTALIDQLSITGCLVHKYVYNRTLSEHLQSIRYNTQMPIFL